MPKMREIKSLEWDQAHSHSMTQDYRPDSLSHTYTHTQMWAYVRCLTTFSKMKIPIDSYNSEMYI